MKKIFTLLCAASLTLGANAATGDEFSTDEGLNFEVTGESTVTFTGYDNYDLTVLDIPATVTDDDDVEYTVTAIADEACQYDTQLEQIIIPATVETIGECAFENCYYVEQLTLKGAPAEVGYAAFGGLDMLERVVCESLVPPTFDVADAFDYADVSAVELMVPKEAADAYREAEGWQDFDVQTMTTTAVGHLQAAVQPRQLFTLSGRAVSTTAVRKGIYVAGGKCVVVK